MKRNVLRALFLALAFCLTAALTSAQTAPQFKLGFKALADQVPDVVGQPLEDEHWGANGDSLQRTTTGLMVWRKADNWTAFTNGSRTWINGPNGVQERGNEERFPWENEPIAATPAPAQPTAVPAPAPTATAAPVTQPAASSKDACLACHGPFDKLVTSTANYVWPNGDKQTPHRYVPHASKDAKDIPECSRCHKAHPVPPTASDIAAMGKADPQWCYSCHHTGDLTCGTCHPAP